MWNISFISEEDFEKHVLDTYGRLFYFQNEYPKSKVPMSN